MTFLYSQCHQALMMLIWNRVDCECQHLHLNSVVKPLALQGVYQCPSYCFLSIIFFPIRDRNVAKLATCKLSDLFPRLVILFTLLSDSTGDWEAVFFSKYRRILMLRMILQLHEPPLCVPETGPSTFSVGVSGAKDTD